MTLNFINEILQPSKSKKILILFLIIFYFLYFYIPYEPIKLSLLIGILFIFPGIAILSFLKIKEFNILEIIIISITIGFIFQIFLFYFLSLIINPLSNPLIFYLPLLLLFFAKIDRIKLPTKRELLFFALMLIFLLFFSLLFLHPASFVSKQNIKDVGYSLWGDDSKQHLLLIKSILNSQKIPESLTVYSEFKPFYPLGYHLIVSLLHTHSNTDLILLTFFFNLFLVALILMNAYVYGKTISKNPFVGLLAMSLIGCLFPIIISFGYGHYPSLLNYSILIIFFFFFQKSVYQKQMSPLLYLLLPSIFYTHPIPFTIVFPSIAAVLLLLRRIKWLLKLTSITFILLVPFFLLQFPFEAIPNIYTSYQHSEVLKKKYTYPHTYNLQAIIPLFLFSSSPVNLLLLFLFVSLLFERKLKNYLLSLVIFVVSLLLSSFLLLAGILGLSLFRRYLSIWKVLYIMLFFLSLPAIDFFSNKSNKIIIAIIFILLFYSFILHYFRDKFFMLEYPTTGKDVVDLISFVNNTIDKDKITYNDWPFGNSITFLPPLAERKITAPFLINHLIKLSHYYLEREIIKNLPDSEIALGVLRNYNASYIAFSTGFELGIPNLDPYEFKHCYKKIYGKYDNWIFEINYSCTLPLYLPVFSLKCKKTECFLSNISEIKLRDVAFGPEIPFYLVINSDITKSKGNALYSKIFLQKEEVFELILPKTETLITYISPKVTGTDEFELKILGDPIPFENITILARFDEYKKINDNIYILTNDSEYHSLKVGTNRILILNENKSKELTLCYKNGNFSSADFYVYNNRRRVFEYLTTIFSRKNDNVECVSIELPEFKFIILYVFVQGGYFEINRINLGSHFL